MSTVTTESLLRNESSRQDLLSDLASYLIEGVSVDLVGMRGSGRSSILRQVKARLEDREIPCILIEGNRALRGRPLSAFSGPRWFAAHTSLPPSLPAAVRLLSDALEHRSAVIIVDDADDVDEVSAGAILAARGMHPVLMATRPAAKRREGVFPSALAHAQSCVQISIPPLRFDQIHLLLHDQLPGTIDPNAVARISTKAGGLPGLIREIVIAAQHSGVLVSRDNRWSIAGPLWTERLISAAESYLDDLDTEQLDVLTQLAVLGTSTFEAVQDIASLEVIDGLEAAGVLRVLDDQSATFVGIYPPLISEYLVRHGSRSSLTKARSIAIAAHTEAGGAVPPNMLAQHFDAEAAVILSRRITGYWHSQSLALRQTWEAVPSTDNALALVLAMHSASAQSKDVDQVIAMTDTRLGTPLAGAKLFTRQAFNYCVERHDLPGAIRILNDARQDLPQYDGLFAATIEHLRFLTEEVPALAAQGPQSENVGEIGAEAITSVHAEILVAAGATRAALELMDVFVPEDDVFQSHIRVTRALALVLDGRVDEGIALAISQVNAARAELLPGPLLANSYVAALGLALRGDFILLDEVLSSAFTLVEVPPMYEHYRVGLVVLGATAARWQDRSAFAEMFADQAISLQDPDGPFPAMVPGSARLLDPSLEINASAEELWELAEARFVHGYVAAGLFTGMLAVEMLPDAKRGMLLGNYGKDSQSVLLQGFGAYGVAAGARDVEGLAEVIDRFIEAGSPLLAVQAGITRALILREQGDFGAAAEQIDSSWERASGFGGSRGMFSRFSDTIVLTERELDIALAILQGDAPTRIAERLNLSVRTVENHVLNIYRKVGVDSRQRLVRAAGTWLGVSW